MCRSEAYTLTTTNSTEKYQENIFGHNEDRQKEKKMVKGSNKGSDGGNMTRKIAKIECKPT